ncbi:hypothetical protein [Actinomadura chokoriensis]|uniref:Uncharacterized protein n=1 Tax=Actinomadura chokoriensis TaxID=454156 RepID=A0ABV4QP88_9ACTN
MTEWMPDEGSAEEGRREPDEQVSGAWPMPAAAEDQRRAEGFRPDSPEGRGGRMEDLSPDDFE